MTLVQDNTTTRMHEWMTRVAGDAVFNKVTTGLESTLSVVSGSDRWYLQAGGGGWRLCDGENSALAADVCIEAAPPTWAELLYADPVKPGWQSFGAIIRQNDRFKIGGSDVNTALLLPALERMIELAHADKQKFDASTAKRDISLIAGKYTTYAEPLSPVSPVYWEESGTGTPLVMLHTAGADSRQYRHQLSDVEVAQSWHMFAFDMPGHGRSGMPAGWTAGQEYVLTQRAYLDECVRFIEHVVKAPAVIMGCSMGAAMALVLAAERPDLVLGVIALEAPWRAPGRQSPLLADARINSTLHNPSYVRALLGPRSPQSYRDEACWVYNQAGFGIYRGDLGFYSNEFDGDVVGRQLAATGVKVHLLTGSYDYSATPDNTRKLAALIPQARLTEMVELGHFPMSENPDGFRPYWLAALQKLQAQLQAG